MKYYFLSFLLFVIIQTGYTQNNLKIFGYLSTGAEMNRNIRLSDNSSQAGYDRLLLKMNFGFKYIYNDYTFSGRLTTGNAGNPRNAYVNLGNSFSQKSVFLDKAYVKYKRNNWMGWIGKNSINLWKSNEILWDNDIKPEGIGISKEIHFYDSYVPDLKINTGYFILGNNPYDSTQNPTTFDRLNNLSFVQVRASFYIRRIHFILSPLLMHARLSNSLNANIFSAMFRYTLPIGYRSYRLYANYYRNFSNYDNNNLLDANLRNKKTGYDVGVSWRYRKFNLKLMYAYIEKYAVIDFLSQDNWLIPAVDHSQYGSNFKGWSTQISYRISHHFRATLHLWYAKQIHTNVTNPGLFEATRMRLNFIYRF